MKEFAEKDVQAEKDLQAVLEFEKRGKNVIKEINNIIDEKGLDYYIEYQKTLGMGETILVVYFIFQKIMRLKQRLNIKRKHRNLYHRRMIKKKIRYWKHILLQVNLVGIQEKEPKQNFWRRYYDDVCEGDLYNFVVVTGSIILLIISVFLIFYGVFTEVINQ